MKIFEEKVLEKLDQIIDELGIEKTETKLELEDHNFKINSNDWKKITVVGKRYLVNDEKDIWELLDSEYKGEQLFTYDAAIRETKKAGKRMPTDKEFDKILNSKKDLKNIKYVGYCYTYDSFYELGLYLFLWSSTLSGSSYAWNRGLNRTYSTVYRHADIRALGFSVRCIKN